MVWLMYGKSDQMYDTRNLDLYQSPTKSQVISRKSSKNSLNHW